MTKKIFLAVFLTAFISSLSGIAFTAAALGKESLKNLDILTIIAAILTLLIITAAFLSARNIVRPIKNIDPRRPRSRKAYKELSPILDSLKKQNGRVNRYIAKLTDSREQLSIITENMKEGIVIADPKTIVLSCNTAAYRLMCAEPLNEGQSIYTLSNDEPFRRCIQDAMGGRRSDIIVKTELGDRRVIASPASISDTINGIVVFIMDVTEEQALEKMRREFTANVSHELKTPLTAIYGISDMLANGMVRQEDVASFGENIRSEANRLISLIEDIVALSKLDENNLPRQNEEVDLCKLSEEVLERLSKAAAAKNITCKLIGDNVTINGNRTVLDEIIYNLCDNAIKYNRDGGSCIVRVSHIPTKAIITVTDTGIGIPDEHIDRIFERFYRVDKSRSRKINGTGLGLSIVKHGVSYHNGTVRAVSSENGSVFIVELPLN